MASATKTMAHARVLTRKTLALAGPFTLLNYRYGHGNLYELGRHTQMDCPNEKDQYSSNDASEDEQSLTVELLLLAL